MSLKKRFSKFFLLVFVSIFCSLSSSAFIHQNGAGGGYVGDIEGAGKNNTIESMVVDGAGYFLAAYSDVLELLQRVELSDKDGMDYTAAQDILGKAITNLENARDTYSALTNVAGNTPYNPQVIEKLKQFDYHTFQVNNNLNPVICKEVEAYLLNGDINGNLLVSYQCMSGILPLLHDIENDLAANRTPSIEILWQVNKAFANELLRGQTVAQIFQEISK